MSKLAKALQFNQAGNIPHQSMDFVSADLSVANMAWDKEYKLTAKLHARAVLTQEALDDSAFDVITQTKKRLQHLIIEEVFGEFRDPLHEVRKAIYNHDENKALDALNKLYNQMFLEGIE